MRARRQKPASRRNLRLRPEKPALGNGRLQRQAKHAFWGCGSPLSTSEILEWAYPRKVLGERIGDGHRWSCRRALESIGAVWSSSEPWPTVDDARNNTGDNNTVLQLCHTTFAGISTRWRGLVEDEDIFTRVNALHKRKRLKNRRCHNLTNRPAHARLKKTATQFASRTHARHLPGQRRDLSHRGRVSRAAGGWYSADHR